MSEYETFPDYRAMEYNEEEIRASEKKEEDECGYDQVVDQLNEE